MCTAHPADLRSVSSERFDQLNQLNPFDPFNPFNQLNQLNQLNPFNPFNPFGLSLSKPCAAQRSNRPSVNGFLFLNADLIDIVGYFSKPSAFIAACTAGRAATRSR